MKRGLLVLLSAAWLALNAAAQIKITPGSDKIEIEIGGKPYRHLLHDR